MSQLEFDEDAARQLEAVYLLGDAVRRSAEAWVAGQRELGERGEYNFAIIQFCFSARKPG